MKAEIKEELDYFVIFLGKVALGRFTGFEAAAAFRDGFNMGLSYAGVVKKATGQPAKP